VSFSAPSHPPIELNSTAAAATTAINLWNRFITPIKHRPEHSVNRTVEKGDWLGAQRRACTLFHCTRASRPFGYHVT
jgi:hypothetical protein